MQKSLAEFAGTFFMVFCGTGAIIINETSGGAITHPGIAAVFGLVVFALILSFASVSGAHFNPAVTITQLIRKKIGLNDSVIYIASQIGGAITASALLHLLFPLNEKLGATLPAGPEWQSFALELLLTFFLMLSILRSSEGGYSLGVIASTVGAVVGLEALFAGPICGASMNPARSLGPALISGHTEHLWMYIIAPIAGALLAAIFHSHLNQHKTKS
jgi:aquaporin NIP